MHKGSISACLHTSKFKETRMILLPLNTKLTWNFAISYQKTEDERDAFAIAS